MAGCNLLTRHHAIHLPSRYYQVFQHFLIFLSYSFLLYLCYLSGEIVFSLPAPTATAAAAAVPVEPTAEPTVTITLGMTKAEGLTATVTLTSDSSVLATVNIPSSKISQ